MINFGDLSEAEARQWPDLMAIVEQKVKPERMKNRRALRRRYWWRFGETTPALFRALSGRQRVIVNSQISTRVQFALVRADMVFSHGLNVFPLEQLSAFAVLQSRPHELWANFFGSSMKDDLRYTPSRCFETFPFPEGWRSDGPLERAGTETHDYRARLMADPALRAEVMEEAPPQGMTQTYNRLHDPRCTLPGIVRLRQLHDEMDRAVLDAYGWGDLQPRCAFLPDAKGTSVSYRWPDAVQDAVLGRLIALSQHRHAAEVAAGTHRDGG